MNPSAHKVILVLIDSLLLITVLGVAPFAWILRDGLGPDSVTSNGFDALIRASMTFYAGPTALCLAGLRFLVCHSFKTQEGEGRKENSSAPFVAVGFLFGGLTLILIGLIFD